MGKILIIGQALPAVKQHVPYDTTMLYDMLGWVGINITKAQELFEFDAVYDKFPGFDEKGGHLKPSLEQFEDYWERSLKSKFLEAKKVLVLGKVAESYLFLKCQPNGDLWNKICVLPHPSRRNHKLIMERKQSIIEDLNYFLSH